MSHKIEIVDGKLSMIIEGNIKVTSWSGGGKIVGMTPDEARAFVADVTAAIESIAQVRIDRWLTPADIEKHGDRWEWHSVDWTVSPKRQCTATFTSGRIMLMCGNIDYFSGVFSKGDYFTPIKGDK